MAESEGGLNVTEPNDFNHGYRPSPLVHGSQSLDTEQFPPTGVSCVLRRDEHRRENILHNVDRIFAEPETVLGFPENIPGTGSDISCRSQQSSVSAQSCLPTDIGESHIVNNKGCDGPGFRPKSQEQKVVHDIGRLRGYQEELASFPTHFPRIRSYGDLPEDSVPKPGRSFSFEIGARRRTSRRSTRRSTMSSTSTTSPTSPASVFLSNWRHDESLVLAELDDEGQTIGGENEYTIGRQIGHGGFSVVKEVYSHEDGQRKTLAVKIVRKQVIGKAKEENQELQSAFQKEVSIWKCLKHPYVLPLLAVYENEYATFCITHINATGTLHDLVRHRRRSASSSLDNHSNPSNNQVSKSTHHPDTTCDSPVSDSKRGLPINLAKRYIHQLASALHYLHLNAGVVHCDLKLENCLLVTRETAQEGHVLLCDFGMAGLIPGGRSSPSSFSPSLLPATTDVLSNNNVDHVKNAEKSFSTRIGPAATSAKLESVSGSSLIAGSLHYASPELIQAIKPIYDPSIDIWAFGVVCYALLSGELPFNHTLLPKLRIMILNGDWDEKVLRTALGADMSAKGEVVAPDLNDPGTANPAASVRESMELAAAGDNSLLPKPPLEATNPSGMCVTNELENAAELLRRCLEKDVSRRWSIKEVLKCAFLEGSTALCEGALD